ncbi:flippase [Francisella philomiragia]|uniref:flippase n=1 Tax=Francisella philomiragia TaxID=28110 RepID=UPI00190867FE|nr:flippase [Francisella philomiragia]MBK2340598.1 flippase [Francisella philomiragia]
MALNINLSDGFKKYFANTGWLFIGNISRMLAALVVGIWVARYLGPEKFGVLNYASSFVALFSVLTTLGLDGIVVRELVKDPSKSNTILGSAFGLKFIGFFALLIILSSVLYLTDESIYTKSIIFIVALSTMMQSFNVLDFYFQSQVKSKFVAFANLISLIISSITKIILILCGAKLIYFAAVVVLDSFTLSIGFIYFYQSKRFGNIKKWRFKFAVAKSLLRDSWPLILSGSLLMIQARIDQVMLNYLADSEQVGYLSVAIRLIEPFAFIIIILKSSLFPAIQNAKKHSYKLYQDRLLNFYRLAFISFLVVGLPIYFFSEKIVVILFGEIYKPASILLTLMSIRLFFAYMGVARGVFLVSENYMKFSAITMFAGVITNILLNLLWIPEYQAKGAVYATIVSFLVTVFLLDFCYKKTRENVVLQIKAIFTFYKLIKIRNI